MKGWDTALVAHALERLETEFRVQLLVHFETNSRTKKQ